MGERFVKVHWTEGEDGRDSSRWPGRLCKAVVLYPHAVHVAAAPVNLSTVTLTFMGICYCATI